MEKKSCKKFIYANYSGENDLGVPSGKGELDYDSPLDLLDDKHLPHQIRVRFRGEFENGMMKSGFLQFLDNSFYIGDFKHNNFHGLGRLTYIDGIYYQGKWLGGVKHGAGEEQLLNGDFYVGSYNHGERHGIGRLYTSQSRGKQRGMISYQGEWHRDKPCGSGL